MQRYFFDHFFFPASNYRFSMTSKVEGPLGAFYYSKYRTFNAKWEHLSSQQINKYSILLWLLLIMVAGSRLIYPHTPAVCLWFLRLWSGSEDVICFLFFVCLASVMLTRVCVENTAPYWAVKGRHCAHVIARVVYASDDSEGTTFITSIFITIVHLLEQFRNALQTATEIQTS